MTEQLRARLDRLSARLVLARDMSVDVLDDVIPVPDPVVLELAIVSQIVAGLLADRVAELRAEYDNGDDNDEPVVLEAVG